MKINYRTKGFSLLELLIAIAIVSFIMVVLTNFQVNIINYNQSSSDDLKDSQDARYILIVILKELRSAQSANTGAYALAQAATSSITFYSDNNGDGLREQIRYFISTTTPVALKKGVIIPTGLPLTYNSAQEKFTSLTYDIRNGTSTSLFEYFDNTYSGTSSPLVQPVTASNVRLVKINLLIDANPNKSPLPRLYTSQVMLRNLKDNL